jgi:hypothetical protein
VTERNFYSVKEFCARNSISRASFYRIKWGALRPVKFGRKTLVPIACERAWQAGLKKSLPASIPITKLRYLETA